MIVQRWKSCLSDSQHFCGAAFSRTVLVQNQLAECHDYTACLNRCDGFLRSVELLKVEEGAWVLLG